MRSISDDSSLKLDMVNCEAGGGASSLGSPAFCAGLAERDGYLLARFDSIGGQVLALQISVLATWSHQKQSFQREK